MQSSVGAAQAGRVGHVDGVHRCIEHIRQHLQNAMEKDMVECPQQRVMATRAERLIAFAI